MDGELAIVRVVFVVDGVRVCWGCRYPIWAWARPFLRAVFFPFFFHFTEGRCSGGCWFSCARKRAPSEHRARRKGDRRQSGDQRAHLVDVGRYTGARTATDQPRGIH